MMASFIYETKSEADTAALGAVLGEILPAGSVVALCGTLGAGKTRLVQAIAAASGVAAGVVVSPTFVLIQEYEGKRDVYHIDAYRLRDAEEFSQLGPEEYFESDGLTLIEWADRVAESLPEEHLEVRIEVAGPEARRFEVLAHGPRYEEVLGQLQRRLDR
jgi:tRNA threonylcarbamoyladenosine biosynthesis protein TsaE